MSKKTIITIVIIIATVLIALAYFKYSSWYTIVVSLVTLAVGYYLGYKYRIKVEKENNNGNRSN